MVASTISVQLELLKACDGPCGFAQRLDSSIQSRIPADTIKYHGLMLLEYPIVLQAAKISLYYGISTNTNITYAGTHTIRP